MMDDVHRQGKMKGLHRGSQISGHSRLFVRAGIMALAVTALSVMSVGVTPADDQSLPSMTIGYQNGTVTAIDQESFQIDGRTYRFTPDVSIHDDTGREREPAALRLGIDVKFHVKKDENDKIDIIILILPR